jgi:hypothetical protein
MGNSLQFSQRQKSWKPSDRIVSRRIRGELLLVPIRSDANHLDEFFALNASASDIWTWAAEGCSFEQISTRLTEKYLVDPSVAQDDAQRTLNELVAIGALKEIN